MSDFACFFNSPSLGGAERSFALQLGDLKRVRSQWGFRVYLPYLEELEECTELKNFLHSQNIRNTEIFYYRYHPALFRLGRTGRFGVLSQLFQLTIGLSLTIRNLSHLQLKNPDIWWVGGNKVGFVVFLLGILSGFKGKFLWHFRDYPYAKGIYRLLPFVFKLPHSFTLESLSNSYDVNQKVIKSPFIFSKNHVLYNPVSDFKFHCKDHGELSLGCASMLAPWKGLHSMILFASLYENKLKELGFKKFLIFGDQIYKTQGSHSHYKEELKQLAQKFESDFVIFKGLKKPQDIFDQIDVFIHSSLEPEPFGRVIVESFKAGSLVVSTGLGGAGELIEPDHDSLKFIPYDYEGLFQLMKRAASEERFRLVQNASQKARMIEEKYFEQLKLVFGLDLIKGIKKA